MSVVQEREQCIFEEEAKTIDTAVLDFINESKRNKTFGELFGNPIVQLSITPVNLDWNYISRNYASDFPKMARDFQDIPKTGVVTERNLFLSPAHTKKHLEEYIKGMLARLSRSKEFNLDFLHEEYIGPGPDKYHPNIVHLYNPSTPMVLKDEEERRYIFRRINPSMDGEKLTHGGLYILFREIPMSLVPDGMPF